jgi:acyl transferase domain-containing protein/NAD(P)-dependent dehydrogenase (short-subunit alcohol dehydrogenase family)
MEDTANKAVAIVGAGAVLPDAPNVAAFWDNVKNGRYSINEVSPDRWNPDYYYDPDPAAPDKSYTKIGGWVREFTWEPMKWKLAIPPRVVDAMDIAQKWAIACTREALQDYGYPSRPLNVERTAVILGNAMAGERHYLTSFRVFFPEYAKELQNSASFATLPETLRSDITRELHDRMAKILPEITEDSMPGELANCIAGRIANTFNFRGPNFVTDAACASAMAAVTAAVEGLVAGKFDAALTGGIDRNMGAPTFVKFCKIGALSATGSRPYADGADGFVMGEGSALLILKRLADAERDGDKIYAIIRAVGASSDGKGKGITAPNPAGQRLAVERAWQNAGLSLTSATMIEGHGTSTRVGDLAELQGIAEIVAGYNLPTASIALGSVKSNIGHLKGAAGAAGLLKTALSLHHKVLPPTINCDRLNPGIDFTHSPLYVNKELKPWMIPQDGVRRAGASAFGFGGTNFHCVLEEHIPGRLTGNGNGKKTIAVPHTAPAKDSMNVKDVSPTPQAQSLKSPLRGALVIGAGSAEALAERLRLVQREAAAGHTPAPGAPKESNLRAPERIAIDYADAADLADKCGRALKALAANQPPIWKALRAQGIFRGHGTPGKVAFLYTGQGSQYVNMMKALLSEPIVRDMFAEADRVMTPLLGKPLSKYIFVDTDDPKAVAKAEDDLRQTAITQPAVLATDESITRMLAAYGIKPDMAMGHSLGEYGALVAAGALPFEDALEAVSARGRGMTQVAMDDNGRMAAIFAPLDEIERILKTVDGYVVIANNNSTSQAVIGGASKAVEQAMELFQKAGFTVAPLPVSHAFHTTIVAGASVPLRGFLERLHLQAPRIPVVANVDGEFYPTDGDVKTKMLDILAQQVAAPVQFVKGLRTLYEAGARVFVETGPKKALQGFVDDVLGEDPEVVSIFTNHPKIGDLVSLNQALCGLYAAGLGRGQAEQVVAEVQPAVSEAKTASAPETVLVAASTKEESKSNGDAAMEKDVPVVITGAALGLPGVDHVFDDENVARILRGEQFITAVPMHLRQSMLEKHITRVVKREEGGGPTIEAIDKLADIIKLAAQGRGFDPEKEFGIPAERLLALDRVTRLAIACGIDALRDAGIPLVMRYKTTTKGTKLPQGWGLPDALRDDTGVIFASAFPGYNSFADEMKRFYTDHARREQLAVLEDLRKQTDDAKIMPELDRRIGELRAAIEKEGYVLDRRFMFRVLSMGHSQFAEFIGVRGPNTQVNSACATTTQAVAVAEDWIRMGRCRRVVLIAADDVTSDELMGWIGSSLLATGAAATDEVVEEAALPFDRRRHGMLVGMGAASMVLESADAARERGLQPICEVLSTVTANSAFHGTRLNVDHITQVMEKVISQAEAEYGISRKEIAPRTVFVSHETYTPARGGSASAEIHALRKVFGEAASQIVIANTKGFTGHPMGTGIEDVVAIKSLETGCVPPVANFKEVDPELGELNLSKGGSYPVEYALRLGAGFGSQISMTLARWVKTADGKRRAPNQLGYEYRITDRQAWDGWMSHITGYPAANLEVVNRTLRVRDQGAAARPVEVAAETPVAVTAALVSQPIDVKQAAAPAMSVAAEEPAVKAQAAAAAAASSAVLPVQPVINPPFESAPVEAAAKAPAPAQPEPQPALQPDSVKERVLALVSEKTGYPIDMLDLDLDLEADLGVDTVKQAEVFAAVRAAYNIPRDENLKLRDFPTLAHVIKFAHDRRPDLFTKMAEVKQAAQSVVESAVVEAKQETKQPEPAVAEPLKKTVAAAPAPTAPDTSVEDTILALVVEKTGYPREMLDLDLDLEADLGVDTVKQAEIVATIRGVYGIPRDENLKLRDFPTLKHVIQLVYNKRPDLKSVPAAVTPSAVETKAVPTVAPVAQQAVPQSAPEAAAMAVSDDEIKAKVLAIVAEKTGYPIDMLDLDLDLEADLGVDTVKQAEMFAAVRGAYNIPRDENLKLRDFPTLKHVIGFAHDKLAAMAVPVQKAEPTPVPTQAAPEPKPQPAPKVEVVPAPAPQPAATAVAVSDVEIKEKVLVIVAEKTGYPIDMLDLDLDLEADLGVDTVKQAEMFAAVRGAYNIPRDENMKLRDFPTLKHVIQFAHDKLAAMAAPAQKAEPAPAPAPVAEPEPAQKIEAAPAQAAVAVPASVAVSDDEIKEKVLAIVAEKTGYPKDMLDLDLDLEADLGVDTVKQAEMFAAVRGAYNIPRDENMKLRDFPTLKHVIQFAHDKLAAMAAAVEVKAESPVATQTTSTPEPAPAPAPVAVPRANLASFDAANSIPRRVPVPVLRPPLSICKPTGVRFGPGSRVVMMPDKAGVADELASKLKAQAVEVLRIDPSLDSEALDSCLKSWLAAGPVNGVYWLAALDNEGLIAGMDLGAWHEALRLRLKSFYAVMRTLYEQIAKTGTFLVSATCLGGQHGYDEAGAVAPMGGAVVGFTKTYKRERPDTLVKVVDFEANRKPADIAENLVKETLLDTGAVEIGYKNDLRWTISVEERPAADGQPGLTLDQNTVFVITGAAGSIVSAITTDLAAASGGVFYLLDLVPKPDPNNPDIKRFMTDKDNLKRDLFARIQARGERATPALVEKELAALERAHAALSAIEAVQNAGGKAHYFSVNLTDGDAVAKVIEEVRQQSGRIDVLLHAAGMERSHFLPDKDAREFNLIFDVKVDGWFNLLHAIGDMPLGATVAFSSIAGRFGNAGQTDYSSANDLLCKYSSSFRTTRPGTRGIAIDWTAWGGIGMATRGSIPKMMEVAGIDMLPPEAGIPLIRRELTTGGTRGEVVIGNRLGVLLEEWDAVGGIEAGTVVREGPMVEKIVSMGLHRGLTVETTLDPNIQPFLHDHQIDGTPVLPGVMGIEGFAEAVKSVLPGWHIAAVEDVNFLAPFKFYRNAPRNLTIEATFRTQGDAIIAECRLIGSRQLPNQPQPQQTTHFTARVRLTRDVPKQATAPAPMATVGKTIGANDVYRVYFHGPAYQVIERAWHDQGRIVAQMPKALPANHKPAERPTAMAPRLMELCFQTAGLWELGTQSRMGLPAHVERVSLLRSPELAEGSLHAVVTPDPKGETFDAEVVDAAGNVYVRMAGYRTVAIPSSADAESLKALRAAA